MVGPEGGSGTSRGSLDASDQDLIYDFRLSGHRHCLFRSGCYRRGDHDLQDTFPGRESEEGRKDSPCLNWEISGMIRTGVNRRSGGLHPPKGNSAEKDEERFHETGWILADGKNDSVRMEER
jgi:hypothetical protein